MILLLGVLLTDQRTFKKCWRCKEDSESHRTVTLEMSLRAMVKRSRGKKQQEEVVKQHYVIVTENNLFKSFTAEGIRNYDQ